MRGTRASLLTVLLMVVATMVGTASPAGAATGDWSYYAASGGTQVDLIGGTVSSGPTGASSIGGSGAPRSTSNGVASVSIPGLVSVVAVSTKQDAVVYGDGVQVTSTAKVAGINLLGGAIKADAIEETEWARATSSGLGRGGDSKLVNLVIGGNPIPVSVSPNTKITIPGLAEVIVNEQVSAQSSTAIQTRGTALKVKLLTDVAGGKVGSTIAITPASVIIANGGPTVARPVGGFAYGTYAVVKATDVQVKVPATALLQIPTFGTFGKTYTNSTASVKASPLVDLGVITSSILATTEPGYADVNAGAETAHVNLLNGLITADAVKVKSHVQKTVASHLEEQSTELVNLKVAGKAIPVNVAPNTTINIAGVGEVIINQQLSQKGYSAVVGLRVIVSTAQLGIPVGTDIQVSVACTYVA